MRFLSHLLTLLALGFVVPALAETPLEDWRIEVNRVRSLAENDIPYANREAQRLQAAMPAAASAADQVRMLNLLSRIEVYLGDTTQAARHAEQASTLAKKNNDRIGQVEADLNVALNSVNQSRFDVMSEAVKHAMVTVEGLDRPDLVGEAMLRTSMMYRRFGRMDDSVEVALKAQSIAKRSHNAFAQAFAYQGVAIAYSLSTRKADAREYYQLMRNAAQEAHSRLLEGDALIGLGSALTGIGDTRSGERLIKEGLALYRKAGGPFYIAHAQHALADNLRQQGRYAEAHKSLDESIAIYRSRSNRVGLWWSLNLRSVLHKQAADITGADADTEQAYRLAREIGHPYYLSESARLLAASVAGHGNHKRAYVLLTEAAEMQARNASENAAARMLDLAKRFEDEANKREIAELTRRNELQAVQHFWLWITLIASLTLLAFIALFMLRLRRSRAEIRTLNIGLESRVAERTDALQRSQRSLAEAQRIARLGSWELDIPGNVLAWSEEVYRIFEIDQEGFDNTLEDFFAVVHPEDRSRVEEAYRTSLREIKPYDIEHRILCPDGRVKYVHERCETIYDGDGKPLRSIGTVQDITERKQVEQKLKESLEFTEGVINAIPDILFEVNREGRYLNVWTQNPELLAAQRAQLLGKTAAEVLSPENAAAAMRAIREADEQGASLIADICIELPIGKRWFSHSLSKKPGGAPGEATFLVLSRDITERKVLEEQLAERERELRALAESSPGMMGSFYLKPDGTVCMPYVSPNIHELFGLRPEQIVEDAAPLMRLNHPDDAQRVMDTIAESARTMSPWRCEYRIIHPTKGERWMEGHTRPYPHPDGGTVWYGYVHDITERKRMEAALQESEARYRQNFDMLQSMLESSSGVSVFALDKNYRYLAFNKRHRERVKFLRNTDIEVGMDMLASLENETFRDFCRKGFDLVLSGQSVAVESREEVVRDGVRVVEYNENYGSPIFDEHGEIVGITVFAVSINARKEAELKLKEALEFSEGIINAIPDLLFEVDGEGRYLNVWTHTPELLAAQKERLLGHTVQEVLAPESAATIMDALQEATELGSSFGKAIRVELPQGESWFELSVSKKPGAQTFLALSRDITARRQMESALSESEARLRALIDNLPFEFWAMDNSLRYIMQNAVSLNHYGNVVGKRIEDLGLPPEVAERWLAQDRDVLAGKILHEEYGRETDGGLRYFESYTAPVVLCDTVIGIVGASIDITTRKLLEEELRHSRNFLNSVIDAVPDPVFVKDRQHNWVMLNDAFCRFIGHPAASLLGKSDYDFFPREEADVFWQKDEIVFNSGEVNLNEEDFTSADGVTHFIQTKKTPFISAAGEPMLVGVIRDITERKQFEIAREMALTEAQRLAKLRSDFIAHMSHELRTPLNGILGYAQMLGRDERLGEKQLASVDVIRHSGEHLLSLIEDILDLARIESGKLELHQSDIPLRHFLQVIERMVAIRAREKNIECVAEYAADLPAGIRGDEKRLRQVLLNLLSNAVKFTARGKIVLNVSRVAPSRLAFAVSDTGVGISASEQEQLFQPFGQVGDAQQRAEGTGLGLAISRQLVRLMGGDITLESRPGDGSTFRFELDLPEVEIQPATAKQTGKTAHGRHTGATEPEPLLVAPPEAEMRELHRLALLGNMRDILNHAVQIGNLDPRYRPFADHLKRLAEGYQSKAILAFVEEYLK